jgi:RNA polymerase-binding protein DksA
LLRGGREKRRATNALDSGQGRPDEQEGDGEIPPSSGREEGDSLRGHREDPQRREETSEELTQDIADKAVSSYTREFLYSLTDGERSTLLQIDDAIARIDDGSYGFCVNCGQVMAEKRLTAVPWAPYCVDCQELSEKGMLPN